MSRIRMDAMERKVFNREWSLATALIKSGGTMELPSGTAVRWMLEAKQRQTKKRRRRRA
jgi:hypothetical protein